MATRSHMTPFLALLLFNVFSAVFLFDIAIADNSNEQTVFRDQPTKKVAIVGAGSGGASAAHYLRKFARDSGLGLNITVFERDSHIGGRSTTVDVFDDPSQPVELGASIFVTVNRNLVSAVKEFGLRTENFAAVRPQESAKRLGVWNGREFVFSQSNGGSYWWDIARLLWKYGLAPIRTQNLMKATVGKFLDMYEAPHFPFRSLSHVAYALDLTGVTSLTGEQYLAQNNIGPPFSTDIIQASTRVNYAQNLPYIHGLEAMVCMATDGAMAVEGGNWKMFKGMIEAAGAELMLNTSVTSINRNIKGSFEVQSTSIATLSPSSSSNPTTETFDDVILAAPFQFANITLNPPLAQSPDAIPYVTLHVTLFTSPHRLSRAFFSLPPDQDVPEVILTTLPPDTTPDDGGAGAPGFFSISTLRTVKNPSPPTAPSSDSDSDARPPPRKEYLYKIFSPARPTPAFLAALLGIPGPSSPAAEAQSPTTDGLHSLAPKDVTWHLHKRWHSYPYLYPRVTFEPAALAPGLWYTSGIESFISTMETSSLMGMNVARLAVDDWRDRGQAGPRPAGADGPQKQEL